MIRAYKYRLYPTRAQERDLLRTLDCLRYFYNACLQERRDGYRADVKVTQNSQQHAITVVKNDPACPDYTGIHTHLLQDVTWRAGRTFKAFFRRVAAGEVPVLSSSGVPVMTFLVERTTRPRE